MFKVFIDIFISMVVVVDYKVVSVVDNKIKKIGDELIFIFVKNFDILVIIFIS